MKARALTARFVFAFVFAVLLALAPSCAPITYSREAPVDFARYASVRVNVQGSDGGVGPTRYLADELKDHSGFRSVTSDGAQPVDALLLVELEVDYEVTLATDGSTESSYTAYAYYELQAPDGSVIDSGVETDETNGLGLLLSDVGESALDKVVLHYLRPFRI